MQGRSEFLEDWEGGNIFWKVGKMEIFFEKSLGKSESIVDKFARWAYLSFKPYFQTLSWWYSPWKVYSLQVCG